MADRWELRRKAPQNPPGHIAHADPKVWKAFPNNGPQALDTLLSNPPPRMRDRSTATSPVQTDADDAYLGIVENSPFGIYIVDAEFKLITISLGARKVFSAVKNPVGKDFAQVMAALWPEPFLSEALGRFRHTLATGESYHAPRTVEQRAGSGETEGYDWKLERVKLPDGRWAVVCYFYDMTELEEARRRLKALEVRQTFLLQLSDALRPVSDPMAAQELTTRQLGEHLGASRVMYVEIEGDEQHFTIHRDYANGLQSMAGRYTLSQFSDNVLAEFRKGHKLRMSDVDRDDITSDQLAAFKAIGTRAWMAVPLLKNGKLSALMSVHNGGPRFWSDDEVELLGEVAERTWDAVERARAERSLLERQSRYSTLFNSIDEGFCIIEFLDGPHGSLSDYIHVEANPSYTANAGIPNVVGQKVRDMVPDEAEGWVNIYRDVLLTGNSVRFERELVATGRHLELAAFRIGTAEQRQVAVLFMDITKRKRAEAEARRSQERYQAFMRHSAEGIWRCELDQPMPVDLSVEQMLDFAYANASLAECNDAMARMYGYERGQELEGARLGDLIPRTPENEAYLTAFFENNFKFIGGESMEKHRDGHTVHFSNNLVGIVEDGHVVRVWGTQSDITERKRAEDALKHELASTRTLAQVSTSLVHGGETERLYDKIVAAASSIMGSEFASMQELDAESGHLKLVASHNYSAEAKKRFQWITPQNCTSCSVALRKGERIMIDDIEACSWLAGTDDLEVFRISGIRAMQSTPLLSREGRTLGMISTHWAHEHQASPEDLRVFDVLARQAADLIERARSERLLLESESFNRSLMDASPDCVKVLDVRGQLLLMNPPGMCLMEVDDFTTIKGNHWCGLWPKEEQHHVQDAIDRALAGEETEFEAFCPTAKGTPKWWEVRVRPVRESAGGPVVRILSISRDVTEKRGAEHALRDADQRKDEFLATLAHELRNPLAPLRNGLEVLQTAMDEPETLERIREMMDRQVNQMAHLVDDLLDLSRISRGVIELRRASMDVHVAIHHAMEASKPLLQSKGHKLLLELHMAPLMVDADSTRLSQIFGNLLDNAGKYTDPGGTIHVTSRVGDGNAEISIRDTGIGLTAEQAPKVFDMFSQVDRQHDRTRGGLGIGLHIVKRLAEMHGGSITVTSEGLQKGSCFTLRLPLSEVPAPARASNGHAATTRPLRVLLTDDNVDAVTMLSMLLRKAGHQVVVAHSGEEALQKGADLGPQVIILDIGMPGMDGYETCRRLRALEWGKAAYVVALTGWGQSEDRQRSREAGFDHHLVKPVDRAELVKVLSTVPT